MIRRLLSRLEINRAVGFVLLARGWQLLAGPATVLLLAHHFSKAEQGYYYTFFSLIALQTFVELGLYNVVTNLSSHEWAHLSLDADGRIAGDERALSRLVSLGRFIFKWYAAASATFALCVGIGGYIFLSSRADPDISWQAPWITLVTLTGLILWALPFNALLEGCGQIEQMNRFRLTQALIGSAALWLTIALDGGLWAVVASMGVALLRDVYLLLIRYRRFFEPFFRPPANESINWKTEIWPLQWRLAAQGLFSYFLVHLYTPVLFKFQGPEVAGQMGMTMQIVGALQGIAMIWVQTNVPRYGLMVARKEYDALDRVWWRTSLVSLGVMAAGCLSAWLAIYVLNYVWQPSLGSIPLSERFLLPLPAAILFASTTLTHTISCQAAYLRAFKREPFLVSGLVTGAINGGLVLLLAYWYGATGATAANLIVTAGVSVPWITLIWLHGRKHWRT
jgi:hypothetical protein